ncbi:hypothetical protein FBU30_005821 [Linnemannia zychae]|nr:hypothetical protein FBU30_005821 [Linnemannia zychae]
MVIYNSLHLYINADTFTLEPVHNDPSAKSENIVIHRATGELRFNASTNRITADEEVLTIYGVIGFIRLLAGEYMIVITDRTKIGRLGEHDIFSLKKYKILPFSQNYLSLSEAQTNQETAFVTLLHQHLDTCQFYFSYGYEITHTLQRQSEFRGDTRPFWERADERFFWNLRLQSKFIDHMRLRKNQDLSRFILPIMNGFAEIKPAEINKRTFTFALISRRSRHRAGTRYFSRGIDALGNVSNYNETEHIIILDPVTNALIPSNRTVMAHVQTRGSIPVFWTQINNIKYTPKLQIFDNPDTETAFKRHFELQKRYYGPQLVINLINKKGYESPMGTAFSKQIDIIGDPQVKYYHFDFHHECSKMKWHRVSLLLDHFHSDLVAQGYFRAELGMAGAGILRVYQKQTSVVRTNCMDCLDRTNVVQSVISRWVLNRQLNSVGVLTSGEQFDSSEEFEALFRNVWADNADVVSCAYSGTGALKTDFTRTGKRTKLGALRDLQNSIVRYIKNNFMDGSRQDAYDLFLGVFDLQEAGSVPVVEDQPLILRALPTVLIVGFAMLTTCVIVPETIFNKYVILFASFWIALMAYVIRVIIANGVHYVNWPKLVPLDIDLPENHFPGISESKLDTGEIELGWKNE